MSAYRFRAFTIQVPAGDSKVLLFNSVSGKKALVSEALLRRLQAEGSAAGSKPERFVLDNFLVRTEDYAADMKRISEESARRAIESTRELSLYIVTTRECNFRCPYCSMEDNILDAGGYMKKGMVRSLAKWMNRRAALYPYERVLVSLYGGEPLYDPVELAALMKELNDGVSLPVVYVAASNGYNMDRETVLRLKELGLKQVQVTLDGPPEVHDKRRLLANSGGGTFRRILDNIKGVCDILPVCVRVNVDSQNAGRLEELFSLLKAEGLAGRVPVDAAPVQPGCSDNEHCGSFALEGKALKALVDAWRIIHGKGFKMAKRVLSAAPCTFYARHAFTIDLGGDIYPCPGMIGYKGQICGRVDEEAAAGKRVPDVWEKCVGCENIFSCAGGCRAVSMAVSGSLDRRNCDKKNTAELIRSFYTLMLQHDDNFSGGSAGSGR